MKQEKLLTLQEVADRLEVSYSLVYRWVQAGRIKATPPIRVGYLVRVSDCVRPFDLKDGEDK